MFSQVEAGWVVENERRGGERMEEKGGGGDRRKFRVGEVSLGKACRRSG